MIKASILGKAYRNIAKPIFFLNDPEKVHDKVTNIGSKLGEKTVTRKLTKQFFHYSNTKLEQDVLGMKFENPIGLGAGFDKDANLMKIMPEIGFGFMSIGSITSSPYEGNPAPRLYRLKKTKGLVVYYGLKNIGVDKIIEKLKKYKPLQKNFPISISVAKTNCKDTVTEEEGIKDYCESLKKLEEAKVGNIYEINISCPNTFGGEPFTTSEKLDRLLTEVSKLNLTKPIVIKMPINLPWEEFKSLLDIALKHKISGVIIGNLNKERDPKLIKDQIPENVKGGISGKPTFELSNNLIEKTYKYCGDRLIIIGMGGVFNAYDAYEKIKRGATLVQLITGMIFQGPQVIGEINKGLVTILEKEGLSNINEAVGRGIKL